MTEIEIPEALASPPLSTPWVPLWPTSPAIGAGLYKIADITRPDLGPEIDILNIPQNFNALRLYLWLRTNEALGSSIVGLRFNNDSGANYDFQVLYGNAATAAALGAVAQTYLRVGSASGASAPANVFSPIVVDLVNYRDATANKAVTAMAGAKGGTAAADNLLMLASGHWRSNAAITRITAMISSGAGPQYVAGSRVILYGIDPINVPVAGGGALGYGTSLPTSPFDGQEYTLVDSVTSPTYQWRFRYNAGSASAYKWEFVGGSDARAAIATAEATTTAATWLDLATVGPRIIVPRAGDYQVEGGAMSNHSVANAINWLAVYKGTTLSGTGRSGFSPVANAYFPLSVEDRFLAVAAGDDLRLRYHMASAGTANWHSRWIRVRPERVS